MLGGQGADSPAWQMTRLPETLPAAFHDRGSVLPTPISLDIDDSAQHLVVVRLGASLDFGKEGPKVSHLLSTLPEVSLVSFANDPRESLNTLALNRNL